MQRMAALGTQAQALQGTLEKATTDGAQAETLVDVVTSLASMVGEAEALEAAAREQDFIDVVRNATSLRQQLSSAHSKMQKRITAA
jgi:hypothetical protein